MLRKTLEEELNDLKASMDILISASYLNQKNSNGIEITQLQSKFESLQRRMVNEGVKCSYITDENFFSWFVRNTSTATGLFSSQKKTGIAISTTITTSKP